MIKKLELLKKAKQVIDAKALDEQQRKEDKIEDIEALNIATMIKGFDTGFGMLEEAINNLIINKQDILEAIKGINIENKVDIPKIDTPIIPKIEVPKIELPKYPDFPEIPEAKITVNVPDIKIPKISVPKAEVEVKVPKIKVPDIVMPEMMKIMGEVGLLGVNLENPLPVQLRNADGSPMIIGGGSSMGAGSKNAHIKSPLGQNDLEHSVSVGMATDHYDEITRAINTIDYAHHEIHSGSHYYMEGFTTLGSGATMYVKLVTPDTDKYSHFLWEIQSSNILETTLYEDASGGMAGGAVKTPLNNDRNSTNTSGVVITSGVGAPTVFGLPISTCRWGSRQAGSGEKREDELILKRNTTYLREFGSGANGNIICFKASWYEHKSKSND